MNETWNKLGSRSLMAALLMTLTSCSSGGFIGGSGSNSGQNLTGQGDPAFSDGADGAGDATAGGNDSGNTAGGNDSGNTAGGNSGGGSAGGGSAGGSGTAGDGGSGGGGGGSGGGGSAGGNDFGEDGGGRNGDGDIDPDLGGQSQKLRTSLTLRTDKYDKGGRVRIQVVSDDDEDDEDWKTVDLPKRGETQVPGICFNRDRETVIRIKFESDFENTNLSPGHADMKMRGSTDRSVTIQIEQGGCAISFLCSNGPDDDKFTLSCPKGDLVIEGLND